MNLDLRTLEELAGMIQWESGPAGGWKRSPGEVARFFITAGFPKLKPHHFSGRESIMRALGILNDNGVIEKIVLRLASPLQYQGNKSRLKAAHERLNRLLQAEGYQVTMKDGKPALAGVDDAVSFDTKETPSPSPVAAITLPGKISDGEVKQSLDFWNAEYQKCAKAHAYLASVVLLGAMLEAVLLLVMEKNPEKANTCDSAPKQGEKVKPLHKWTLTDMINVAKTLGWISEDAKDFNLSLRDYRNLIHPRELMKKRDMPDKGTVNISAAVVQKTIDELAGNGLLK